MGKTCTVDGCDRPLDGRGCCRAHYARLVRYGDPLAGGPMRQRRALARRPSAPRPTRYCDIEGCGRKHLSKGLCRTHYNRRYQNGDPDWARPISNSDGRFPSRGGRVVDAKGYVLVRLPKDHPYLERSKNAAGCAYLQEHRYVMAQHLGRALLPNENVHHINGDKGDNRLANLELWVRSQPSGQRVQDRVADALDMLHRYAPHLLADGGEGLPLAV